MTTTRLDFWVENEKLYATLVYMAHDILIIPFSSTPVERVSFQSCVCIKW